MSKKEKKPVDAGKRLRIAKPLVIVPAILALVMILLLVLSIVLKTPLQESLFYKIVFVAAGVLTFALPVPCVACAVIGVVFSMQARAVYEKKATWLILLATVDLAVYSAMIAAVIKVLIRNYT